MMEWKNSIARSAQSRLDCWEIWKVILIQCTSAWSLLSAQPVRTRPLENIIFRGTWWENMLLNKNDENSHLSLWSISPKRMCFERFPLFASSGKMKDFSWKININVIYLTSRWNQYLLRLNLHSFFIHFDIWSWIQGQGWIIKAFDICARPYTLLFESL